MNDMGDFKTYKPSAQLTDLVAYFWTYVPGQCDQKMQELRLLPDGRPGFIIQHNHGSSVYHDGVSKLPVAFLYGITNRSCINYSTAQTGIAGASFQPGAIQALFGCPSHLLANRLVSIGDMFNDSPEEQILDTKDISKTPLLLDRWLCGHLQKQMITHDFIHDSIHKIQAAEGQISLRKLYKEHSVSERKFERTFKERTGIQPYQFARIRRFQAAIKRIHQQSSISLTKLTYDLGFSDQSHFIRDFKTLSGVTPKQYRENAGNAITNHFLMNAKPQDFAIRMISENCPAFNFLSKLN
jgi:AraC-like DNA-binding protein